MIHNKVHTLKKNTQTNTDKNSDENIEYLITMEKYSFNDCHGGC